MTQALQTVRSNPKLAGPHRVLGNYYARRRERNLAAQQYLLFLRKVLEDPSEQQHEARIKVLVQRLTD